MTSYARRVALRSGAGMGGPTVANFKRRRPKGRRSGCLLCKPRKVSGVPPAWRFRMSELRRLGGRTGRVRRRDAAWDFKADGP
jgi:hypothetical protein